MHLLADAPPTETYDRIRKIGGRPRWLDNLRAIVFRLFARRLNYRDEAYRSRVGAHYYGTSGRTIDGP